MPKVRTERYYLSFGDGIDPVSGTYDININADGEFYARVPEIALPYFQRGTKYRSCMCQLDRTKKPALYTKVMEDLIVTVREGIKACCEPDIKRENVILYHIGSKVCFASNASGEVAPTAQPEGFEWASGSMEDKEKYSSDPFNKPHEGGYSITVGAVARTKVTTVLGGQESVKYERYFGEGNDHWNQEHPAARLNAWTGFSLPKKPKEIPYSDDAAEFFYSMMEGLVKLGKRLQDATFEQEDLLALIAQGGSPLLPAPKKDN
ncbi:hypothetical protein [Vibrio phage 29Fa.3]|nr:hypothetical protein [Vibrio phage 29Fa.3]